MSALRLRAQDAVSGLYDCYDVLHTRWNTYTAVSGANIVDQQALT